MSTKTLGAPTKIPSGFDVAGTSADPLTREREAELARRIRDNGDPGAVDELVRANLRFVADHVTRFQGLGVDREDLLAAGAMGLVDAAHRFDPDAGVKFISYAVHWVRSRCFRLIASQALPVRIPDNVNHALMGSSPDPSVRHLNIPPLRLDHPAHDDEDDRGQTAAERPLGPDDGPDLDDMAADGEIRARVRAAVDGLADSRLRYVIRRYFGLDGDIPGTLQDVADVLGVTRERVRQLRDAGLDAIRGPLAGVTT